MPSLHSSLIALHVGAGALGLAAGLVPLTAAKGGRRHGMFGWLFVVLAGGALVAAVALETLYAQPAWLILAMSSAAYQLFGAIRSLRLKGRSPGRLDAVAAVAVLAGVAAILLWLKPANAGAGPLALARSVATWLVLVAGYDLTRPLYARIWSARLRPLDHGLKMTGAFFAMASAAGGNVLRGEQPWSQIGPLVAGFVVMIVVARRWLVRPPLTRNAAFAPR